MNKHRRKQIHEIADSLSQLKTQIDALYGEESASLRVENAITFLEDAEG